MSVRWETEGLQTVGIVCLVIMFLKLMHLLGLIDITETGEETRVGGFEEDRRMLDRSMHLKIAVNSNQTETFCLQFIGTKKEKIPKNFGYNHVGV